LNSPLTESNLLVGARATLSIAGLPGWRPALTFVLSCDR
jgi:hypothetical protein